MKLGIAYGYNSKEINYCNYPDPNQPITLEIAIRCREKLLTEVWPQVKAVLDQYRVPADYVQPPMTTKSR